MAGETTYAGISSFIPDVWEAALFYAQQQFIMPRIVQTFGDARGMQSRKSTEYAAGTVSTGVAETDDLNTYQAFTRATLATLTPAEIGTTFLVTDRRMDTDDVQVMADLAQHVGYTIGKQVETHLLTAFSSFTGGTIGGGGSTLTWAMIYKARAILSAAGVPGPYNVVLHEYSYLQLANAANIAGIANAGPLTVRNDIQSNYYVGSTGDLDFYTTGVLTAGTLVTQGVFNRQAVALDVRRAMRLEPERDATKRATEVVASMIYGYGAWRPLWGVKLLSDASTPT